MLVQSLRIVPRRGAPLRQVQFVVIPISSEGVLLQTNLIVFLLLYHKVS